VNFNFNLTLIHCSN